MKGAGGVPGSQSASGPRSSVKPGPSRSSVERPGELRDGVSAARAAHVLWIAASFDAFDLLHAGRGLRPAEIADILVEGAERAILDIN